MPQPPPSSIRRFERSSIRRTRLPGIVLPVAGSVPLVHEQNERALAVYTAAGYRPDGSVRVSDFRGTRLPELRLVKQL
jgi:hypothetical protein